MAQSRQTIINESLTRETLIELADRTRDDLNTLWARANRNYYHLPAEERPCQVKELQQTMFFLNKLLGNALSHTAK